MGHDVGGRGAPPPLQGSISIDSVPRVPLRSTLGYIPVLTGRMVNRSYRAHGEQMSEGNIEWYKCFMPWKTTNHMTQRELFINDYLRRDDTMTALCRRYGIQRRIGYKWVERYQQNGRPGLEDRSRAPLHHRNRSSPETVERILAIRREHPLWGAPKIRALLQDTAPRRKPPAASTIGEILRHEGLTRPGKKRRRTPPYQQPLAHAGAPNDVVSIDFKGWFRARNGERIDPLTLIDNHSRYVLCCQALDACDYEHVRAVMATVFREYGLPKRIRSDNGAPFASRAIAGLSRLSIWWVKLGIEVERIPPGTPSANGRQERFHRTLKQHTAEPPAATRRAQQREFGRFCREYNEQRPHQALGQRRPASVYYASPRSYHGQLPAVEYPVGYVRRMVGKRGEMYWRGRRIFVSEVLAGEPVGLEAIDDGIYRVWLAGLELGRFDVRENRVAPLSPRGDSGALGGPSQVPAATPAEESDKIVGKEKVFTCAP